MSSSLFASEIHTQEYHIPYQKEFKLHLKEKKLSDLKTNHVILLLNPLSLPFIEAFDVPGYSLMDTLAKAGFDVWGLDFIGEGHSSFPESMEKNPAPCGIFPLKAKEAIPQVHQALMFIRKKTGNTPISLLGWSWGSVVAAMYSIEYPEEISHLILYGSMYSFLLPEYAEKIFIAPYEKEKNTFNSQLPAYQNIPWEIINNHWHLMLQGNKTIVTQKALNAVGEVYKNIDPHPFVENMVRRPMGPMVDLFAIWHQQPVYDIHRLSTPTLVIYGDQDIFADTTLFSQLTQVKTKKEVKLKEATHWLIYEKTREQFIEAVIAFLNNK